MPNALIAAISTGMAQLADAEEVTKRVQSPQHHGRMRSEAGIAGIAGIATEAGSNDLAAGANTGRQTSSLPTGRSRIRHVVSSDECAQKDLRSRLPGSARRHPELPDPDAGQRAEIVFVVVPPGSHEHQSTHHRESMSIRRE